MERLWAYAWYRRTIETMEEYLNIDLKAAARKGVMNILWWSLIKKCAISLLHIIIGLINDIDQHYLKQLEEKVIAKSTDEKAVIAELEAIDGDIKKKKEQLEMWIKSMNGQRLAELELKTKEQDKALKKE